MPVDSPSKQYEAMKPKWQRCRDCYEGSDAVKGRGAEYLPMPSGHAKEPGRYGAYKRRALFYNATGRTVDGLAGMVHQKGADIEVPAAWEDDLDDITLTGVPVPLLALDVTTEVLTTGRVGILVDMADGEDAMRPYAVTYRAEDVISSRVERIGGDYTLTRVVLCEEVEEPDEKDPFEAESVKQYRVLELRGVEGREGRVYTQVRYRRQEESSGKWEPWAPEGEDLLIVPTRRGDPLEFIPFVFIGPTSIEPEVQKPPLLDLADVNISHYMSSAELEHALFWVSMPTAVVIGASNDSGPLHIGGSEAWQLPENGDAKILEVEGDGIPAIERVMERKEKKMAVLGARLLEEQPSTAETATAVGFRHSGEHATLRTIAGTVSQGLTLMLQWYGWWVGTEQEPTDVEASIALNTDFVNIRLEADEVRSLVMAWQAGGMSWDTFYWNLQQGEWTPPDRDVEDERAALVREGAALGGGMSMEED